jgi:hypothetical protein
MLKVCDLQDRTLNSRKGLVRNAVKYRASAQLHRKPPQVSPVSEFLISDYFARSRPHPHAIKYFAIGNAGSLPDNHIEGARRARNRHRIKKEDTS